MDYEYAQRRRTFIAIAITLILGPAAFLLTRGDGETATPPEVTVIGTTPPAAPDDTVAASAPTATDVMGTSPVEVLSGGESASSDDPATIAIPRLPQGVTGIATFSRDIDAPADCLVGALGVPFNAELTVTNLDNSMKVLCTNNVGGLRPEEAIVLHPEAFIRIADLTDAPVPVQISW